MSLRAYDMSEWGLFRFLGPDAKDFLQGLVTADLKKLKPGEALPFCLLTPKGMLVADGELYEESAASVLAVTRPAAAVGFLKAFQTRIMLSQSQIKPLGGRAWLVIGAGFAEGLPWPRLAEPARLLLGVDPPSDAEILTDAEFHALRVASGFAWFGTDLDAETLPLEARQEAAISLDKGCYMGQETVARVVYRGKLNRRLCGLRFEREAPAAPAVVRVGEDEIGRLTSSAGRWGLATLKRDFAEPGTAVVAGGVDAVVTDFPAWPKPLK